MLYEAMGELLVATLPVIMLILAIDLIMDEDGDENGD